MLRAGVDWNSMRAISPKDHDTRTERFSPSQGLHRGCPYGIPAGGKATAMGDSPMTKLNWDKDRHKYKIATIAVKPIKRPKKKLTQKERQRRKKNNALAKVGHENNKKRIAGLLQEFAWKD